MGSAADSEVVDSRDWVGVEAAVEEEEEEEDEVDSGLTISSPTSGVAVMLGDETAED